MDHQEQHRQKKEHERKLEKKERKAHEQQTKNALPFHPAWLLFGAVLTVAALSVWMLVF